MLNIFQAILDFFSRNQVALTIILSPLISLFTVWIIKREDRKLKELELKNTLTQKEHEHKLATTINKTQHERIVYGQLIKILGDIQQLDVELSSNCVNTDCVLDAVNNFNISFKKHRDEVAQNQILLTNRTRSELYSFYGLMSSMQIELKNILHDNKYEFAHYIVTSYSSEMARNILKLHDELSTQISDIEELSPFINCCGKPAEKWIEDEYKKYKRIEEANRKLRLMDGMKSDINIDKNLVVQELKSNRN